MSEARVASCRQNEQPQRGFVILMAATRSDRYPRWRRKLRSRILAHGYDVGLLT